MRFTEKVILDALSTVNDPDLHKDLVTLNMIKDLVVAEDKISFTVMLTTPACPLKEKIRQDCETAIRKVTGDAAKLDITMSASVTSMRGNTPVLTEVKNIIVVA